MTLGFRYNYTFPFCLIFTHASKTAYKVGALADSSLVSLSHVNDNKDSSDDSRKTDLESLLHNAVISFWIS